METTPTPLGRLLSNLACLAAALVSVNPPPSSRCVQHERQCSKKLAGSVLVWQSSSRPGGGPKGHLQPECVGGAGRGQ